jgi:hypothetical protein
VEAHRPQEVPGAADVARLALGEQAAAGAVRADQLGHAVHVEGVAGEPVQRLEVAQAAAAFLDVRFDQIGTLAVAGMARGALRPLGSEEGGQAALRAVAGKVRLQRSKATRSPARKRASTRAVSTVLSFTASFRQSFTLRVAWPTFSPRSQSR